MARERWFTAARVPAILCQDNLPLASSRERYPESSCRSLKRSQHREVFLGEFDFRSGHIFFEVRNRGGTRNRQHHWRFFQQPSKRDLPWVDFVLRRDLRKRALILSEASRRKGKPRNETDVIFLTVGEHVFVF